MGRDGKIGVSLLVLAVFLCYGSLKLGLGQTNNPGPGFFPFLAGVVIGGLSVLLVTSSLRKSAQHRKQERDSFVTRGASLILGSLLIFGFLVERVGFFFCAFFTIFLMLRANGVKKWSSLLLFSFLTCLAVFLVFNSLLDVRLPLGILRF